MVNIIPHFLSLMEPKALSRNSLLRILVVQYYQPYPLFPTGLRQDIPSLAHLDTILYDEPISWSKYALLEGGGRKRTSLFFISIHPITALTDIRHARMHLPTQSSRIHPQQECNRSGSCNKPPFFLTHATVFPASPDNFLRLLTQKPPPAEASTHPIEGKSA